AHDLVIGTHGRSLYKVNVEHLQQLDNNLMTGGAHIFDLNNERYSDRWGKTSSWNKWYGYNEPKIRVPVFVANAGMASIQLKTKKGTIVGEENIELVKGLNYVDLSLELKEKYLQGYTKELKKNKVEYGDKLKEKDNGKHYLLDGDYTISLSQEGETVSNSFQIEPPKEKPERKPQKKTP
ncbi:MAG: hypothetical protein KDC58_00215, partial [Cyclobacteriaceae bacterium]|nr:hypothetical protein [Cyclobacteriaceae bacterium]